MYSDWAICKCRTLCLVLAGLGTSGSINSACIDDFEQVMLRKTMNWHNFWFAPRATLGRPKLGETGIKLEVADEVSYLIWPRRFWIRAKSTPEHGRTLFDIQGISDNKELELREISLYVRRLGSNSDSAIKKCAFEISPADGNETNNRSPESMAPWYREAVLTELRKAQQSYYCPCTIWIGTYLSGDLKAFVLVSGGTGESVVAFSVDYNRRTVRELAEKWLSPRDPVYQEFVQRVKRHALVETLGANGK